MKSKFGKIMVEVDGDLVNITDLPQDEYEHFLDLTTSLNVAYEVIKNSKNRK